MNLVLGTVIMSMSAMSATEQVCPVIKEADKPKPKSSHQPDHDKADILEAQGRAYEMLYMSTGKKHYKDSMDACFGDAKDYRTCGFVRPLGASV